MIWFGIWILLAGFGGYLASNRGRSAATWCTLGFLFGPLAIGILLILGDGDDIKRCPKCFGKCDSRATVCMHCRCDIEKNTTAVGAAWTDGPKDNNETT